MDYTEMTIIMPSYNRGKYIEEAINSVLMQKVTFHYKLIIADDASTDNSLEIAKVYKDKYPDKIEIMPSKVNQGLLANCIRVYQNMKTNYFCVLDADDYWIDDCFLQKAYDFLEGNLEYVIYGANSKILKDGVFLDTLYHTDCENEMTVQSVGELYTGKMKYKTNTLETVFRNVIFTDGIPHLMREAVGTLSEPTFRGDTGRYIIHLKYGYAKFVNEVVSVYRQHDKGIWTSATDLHKALMLSRAQIDYCRFYEGNNKENFYGFSFFYLTEAAASLFNLLSSQEMERIETGDMENLCEIVQEVKLPQTVEYNYDNRLIELMKNKECRKIVVWGTGSASKKLIEKYLTLENISYFVDGNEKKQGMYINNIKVLSPVQLRDIHERKYVIIASCFYNDIIKDILTQGLCKEDEIMNLYKMDCKYSLFFL